MPYLNGAQATIATSRAYDVVTIFGIPGAHTLLHSSHPYVWRSSN